MWKRVICTLILTMIFLLPLSAMGESIRVIQIWDDVNDYEHIRPHSVPVTVIADGCETIITDSDIHIIEGSEFSFLQGPVSDGYTTSSYVVNTEDVITAIFINTHPVVADTKTVSNTLHTSDPPASLTVTKNADVAGSSDVFFFDIDLPETYPYTTSAGIAGTTDSPVPLHNNESVTVDDIPIGTAYTVTELPDPRYVSSSSNSTGIIQAGENQVLFTNNLITTSFSVRKIWQGTARDTITLHLYADGEEVDTAFDKEENTYTASNLPKYAADGHEILYSATEEYMQEYMTMYLNTGKYANRSKAIYDGGTIVNKQVTSFSVRKEWVGVSEENRPEITFQLYQNGKPIVWRQPEYKRGVYVWENLPAMKDGEPASYYVLENPVDGYETSYHNPGHIEDQKALNGGVITNYKIPKTGDSENPLVLVLVILSSFVGITIVLLRKRR